MIRHDIYTILNVRSLGDTAGDVVDHLTTCLEERTGKEISNEKKKQGGLVGVPSNIQVRNKAYKMKNAVRTKGAC